LRADLFAAGYTRSAIQHRITTGKWRRVFAGIYVDLSASAEDQFEALKGAVLLRCGEDAVLSHATAAAFHGFDSTKGWDTTLVHASQPAGKAPPTGPGFVVARSHTLTYDQPVESGGLLYTSRLRTLLDALATLDPVEGERVLESAVRGPDPKRPDLWHTDLLDSLHDWIQNHPRQPGVQLAKRLLALRPVGCRPTGSIAETAGIQALRIGGFTDVIRQPKVVAPDEHGNRRDHFLDTLVLPYFFDIEIDGGDHNDPKRRAEDIKRDRRLAGSFLVIRFTAQQAMYQPEFLIETVKEEVRRRQHESPRVAQSNEFGLTGEMHSWTITGPPQKRRIAS
jgi:hypothetical protein